LPDRTEELIRLVAGLIIAVLFTAAFRVPLRKAPVVFYTLAALLNVLFIIRSSLGAPTWLYEYFFFLFQSNTLGMGFFTIVMFIGVLDTESTIRKQLAPIRAELSILASILSIGHIVNYGEAYLWQLFNTSSMPALRVSTTIIAIILVVLLIPLAITSLKIVRKKMNQQMWKGLQRLSYLFYGLIFVHVALALLPAAIAGSATALISIYIYSGLGGLYATLRIQESVGSPKSFRMTAVCCVCGLVLILSLLFAFG